MWCGALPRAISSATSVVAAVVVMVVSAPCRLSELGSGTMLQMMLVDNLIHSDLHPGNILVRLDPPGGLLGLVYR